MEPWTDATQHARRAREHFDAGRWVAALSEIRSAIQIDPFQPDWHIGLGLTLAAMSQYEESAEAFAESIDLGGEDHDTRLQQGVSLLRAGRPAEARDVLDRAIHLDPSSSLAYAQRVLAQAMLGDQDAAEVDFYLALHAQDEPCPTAYDHLAHALAMRGDYERAINCWRQVLSLDPEHPDVWACLGRAHWRRGNTQAAIRALGCQLQRTPDDQDTRLDQARILIHESQWDDALAALDPLLQQDTAPALALELAASIHRRQGAARLAADTLKRLVQSDPAQPGPRLQLARLALEAGDLHAGRTLIREDLLCEGHEPTQILEAARLLLDAGRPDRAATLLAELLGELPHGSASRAASASATKHANPKGKSTGKSMGKANANASPTDNPNHTTNTAPATTALPRVMIAAARQCRSAALLQSGRLRESIHEARRALRLDRTLSPAWQSLAVAYLRLRRPQRAAACVRRAIILKPEDASLRRLARRIERHRISPARRLISFGGRFAAPRTQAEPIAASTLGTSGDATSPNPAISPEKSAA